MTYQPIDLCSRTVLDQLILLDELIHYQVPAAAGEEWFSVVAGSCPVLVSAPHACRHWREGQYKMQEEYTGAIALYLAQECNCHAIVTNHQTNEDPNWQEISEYKKAIQSLVVQHKIGFIIDLHGMTNNYNMGIALGTIKGESCDASAVESHFIKAGFEATAPNALSNPSVDAWRNVVVDHPKFTGGVVNQTVTRFAAQRLKIKAVQIELASEVRVVESAATDDWPREYYGSPEAIMASVTALQSLINGF